MFKSRLAGAVLGVFAAFSGGVASAEDPDFFPAAAWNLQTLPFEHDDTEQVAPVGELLFRHELRSAAVATFTGSATISVPGSTRWSSPVAEIQLEPGDNAFHMGNVRGWTFFCPGEMSWRSRSWMDGRQMRSCLLDRDNNGVFDRVYWGGPGMLMREWRDNAELSIPYDVSLTDQTRVMTIGPLITRGTFASYRMTVGVRDDGEAVPFVSDENATSARSTGTGTENALSVWFRAGDLPITLELSGARIEVLAISDGQVRYRVLSGFSPGPIGIAYGELPVSDD